MRGHNSILAFRDFFFPRQSFFFSFSNTCQAKLIECSDWKFSFVEMDFLFKHRIVNSNSFVNNRIEEESSISSRSELFNSWGVNYTLKLFPISQDKTITNCIYPRCRHLFVPKDGRMTPPFVHLPWDTLKAISNIRHRGPSLRAAYVTFSESTRRFKLRSFPKMNERGSSGRVILWYSTIFAFPQWSNEWKQIIYKLFNLRERKVKNSQKIGTLGKFARIRDF